MAVDSSILTIKPLKGVGKRQERTFEKQYVTLCVQGFMAL
ncbi:MAG: hypothetical protein Metus_1042 [Candidatus Methanosuratincola subterraneus]|uniref:Uncharacterized protein n=1 Tax=Methanosuratincola subterraneus TaxID=2593994 RepID=A0A3S3S7C1_METS7|nr:MAG: hypothetical protein Metus_1042 [Candidatus Methanosuratincola subterraneus]